MRPTLDVVARQDGIDTTFHLVLGHYYRTNLRVEIDFFKAKYQLKDSLEIIQGGIIPTLGSSPQPLGSLDGSSIVINDGEFSIQGILFNTNYDLTNLRFANWTPYVGAGIGRAQIKLKVRNLVNGKDNKFIYAFRAGASYQLDVIDNTILNVEYAYLNADKPTYTGSNSALDFNSEFKTHTINIGLRINF